MTRRLISDAGVQHRVAQLLARRLAAANVLGRAQVAREVQKRTGRRVELATSSHLHARFAEGDASIGFSFDLPADNTAAYISGLTAVSKDTFNGLTDQYRAEAFTMAGAADVRMIENIQKALAETVKSGGTATDFEAAVNKITDAAGVEEMNAFTLDTAFNTALQKAYSLGRFEQMQAPAVKAALPYWQYWTVGDDHVRPEHRVLQGFTARAEDPVWRKIYPPNGFNCRCSVAPLLASEAPKGADDPGMERLPLLAMVGVPQPGFSKVFAV